MATIHPTAIVEPGAELDASVSVGAYSVVRAHVRIGAGTTIGPHCVIEGHTTIGRDNRIFQFCSIGAVPQEHPHASGVLLHECLDRGVAPAEQLHVLEALI